MNFRPSSLCRATLSLFLLALPLIAPAVFAQDDRIPRAAAGGFMAMFLLVGLVCYVYFALAFQTIAQKTNTDNAWFAWIPILNIILMLAIAKKPVWWIILFFIPLVNIVILVLVWMGVAEARNKPTWWGILAIIPVINLIVPAYLAWSD